MKTLGIAFLWIAAFGFAVWLLLRMRRGKPVVLKGTVTPRFARMVVVILLALGVTAQGGHAEEAKQPAKGQPAAKPDGLPSLLNEKTIGTARRLEHTHELFRKAHTAWRLDRSQPAKAIAARGLPPLLFALAAAERTAGDDALPEIKADALIAALKEAEKLAFINHFTVGVVWRRAQALPQPGNVHEQAQRLTLFQDLYRHARLANALIKAHADVKPMGLSPRAWMSKAGPKRSELLREARIQRALLASSRKHFPTADDAPWSSEASVTLLLLPDTPTRLMVRRGTGDFVIEPGKQGTIGRLDLIDTRGRKTAVVLEHPMFGEVTLPAGRLISVWDLYTHLGKDGRKFADVLASRAVRGVQNAADQLERAVPLTHHAIVAALKWKPDAKGAPRLRTILHSFTD